MDAKSDMDTKSTDDGSGDARSWWELHPEVVVSPTRKVSCDGVGGALGHPRVWYDMADSDHVECKYCDRVFVLKGGSKEPTRAG